MSDLLRSKEMSEKYKGYRESGVMQDVCALCAKQAQHTFTYWKVISNDFPYDVIAKKHDMLLPLRHTIDQELSEEEWNEYLAIKNDFVQEYDYIIEATNKAKSIPAHFHVHLTVGK